MSTAEEKNTITETQGEKPIETPEQENSTDTQEQSNDQGYWKLPKQMSDEYYEKHQDEYTFQPKFESKQYYEKHHNSKPKNKLYKINIESKISANREKEATVKVRQVANKINQEITAEANRQRQLEKLQKMEKNKQRKMGITEPKPKMSTKAYYEKSKTAPRNLRYERDIQRIKERMRARQEVADRYNRQYRDIAVAQAGKDSTISSESTGIGIN